MSRDRLANSRGRWLAFGATLAVSAAMLYAQGTEPPCCVKNAAATAPGARPAPSPRPAPPAAPPHIASPAEAQSLAANAPATAQNFQFSLPVGVAPENGLQVKTIWAARAISLLF
ncbi:MAG: glycoside hydrolase, partial [Mycobacterium sp.]